MGNHEHKSHLKELFLVFVALLVLTGVTVAVAQVDFGSLAVNIAIALIIASVKVSLVGLYFMHLKWENKLIGAFSLVSIPFVIIAVATMVWDVDQKDKEGQYPKDIKMKVESSMKGKGAHH